MKKTILALAGTLFLLAGCGAGNDAATDATTSEEVTTGTEVVSDTTTIFTGVIDNEEPLEQTDGNYLIFLKDVEAVEDPDGLVPTFETDGVGINVDSSLIEDVEAWTQGKTVQVTLEGLMAVTASIPPQVPGDSVAAVELLP